MSKEQVVMKVKGMTCNHCSATVSGIIEQEGGTEVHVDFLLGEAAFEVGSSSRISKIKDRINKAGYQVVSGSEASSSNPFTSVSRSSNCSFRFCQFKSPSNL